MICQQHQELVKPVWSLPLSFSITTKEAESGCDFCPTLFCECVFFKGRRVRLYVHVFCDQTMNKITSRVVYVHEEHILISIQDGVELQTNTHTNHDKGHMWVWKSRLQIKKFKNKQNKKKKPFVMTNFVIAINLV